MIKNLGANNRYIQVAGGGIPYINAGNNMSGNVRWNINSQNLEVYDGNNWINISRDIQLDISPYTHEILSWAEKKMREDDRIQEIVKSNVTVADAYNNYKDAADKLKVVLELVKKEGPNAVR